ncbi:MAG: acyl-CoA dehydrogenase family protein, partial [Pseudomonadota bacterium]
MSYFANEPDHVTEIRRQLQRFVAEQAPREKRREWDRQSTWPRDTFKQIAEMGLIGLTIPEEYGGMGQDIIGATAVIDELCQAGAFLAGPYIHAAFYGGMNLARTLAFVPLSHSPPG